MEHLQDETTDLKLHTHLCAERYKGIQDQFVRFDQRVARVEEKIDSLHKDYNQGNRSLKNTLITTCGTIIVAVISVLGIIITQ